MADLSSADQDLLDSAKLGVLLASPVAGVLGYVVLRSAGRGQDGTAASAGEVVPALSAPS